MAERKPTSASEQVPLSREEEEGLQHHSPLPSPLEHWVRWIGLVLGPLAAVLILWLMPVSVSGAGSAVQGVITPGGRAVLAIGAWMAIWWLSEAAALAATALLPLVLLPLLGAATPAQAAAPYADELIFLFLGGFFLGIALETTGLHRRLAIMVLVIVGPGAKRAVLAMLLVSAAISMFVSNTATAVMMTPLAMSLVSLAESSKVRWERTQARNFAAAMMLAVAFGATIGGMGTIIGTPPNVIMTGYAARELSRPVSFDAWMKVCVPVVVVLVPLTWVLLTLVVFPLKGGEVESERAYVREQWSALGRMRRAEWATLLVFVCTVGLWMFREPVARAMGLVMQQPGGREMVLLTDAVVAILGALALLVVPVSAGGGGKSVLNWQDAGKVPWGVLILFGGGLSLASAMKQTGLDAVVGAQFSGLSGMPEWLVLLVVALVVVGFSELAGNTAVATTVVPIMGAAAPALGVDAVKLLMVTTLACSCGFMLPVSTPPNAVVFATGRVSIRQMMRAGLGLDVVCVVVIVAVFVVAGDWLLAWAGLASK